ncbi:MAG: insulinase family protein [Gemmatales bacterium]
MKDLLSKSEPVTAPGRYPGWFGIQMEMLPGKDRKKAEQIVLAEIRRLAIEPVPANELQRIQRMIISQSIFSREGIHSLADSIAKTVLVQPASALKEQFTKWAAVTPADIQRVAKLYLDADKPVVVWSIPKEEKGGGAQAEKPKEGNRYRNHNKQPQGGVGNVSLQQAKKVVLPNGLTLLLMENRRLPLVVAAASLNHVRRYEPAEKAGVAQLMGSLLEEGTEKRTGQQIAEAIEDVGGTLSMVAAGGSMKVLRDHKQLGLELLFDSLLHPSFPAEAFERKKDEQLAEIAEAQEQPLSRASEAFQETIFGKHFKGRPSRGSLATVQKLTRDDVVAFHKLVMVPDNTALAIVGDFDSKEMIDLVTKLTADWKGKLPPAPATPELTMAKGTSTKLITMPNSAQLQFLMGHLGIKRNHPDYFKLLVMDNVLGSGAGFTDRLSSRLRDREGLAYTVNATITDSAEIDPALSCATSALMPATISGSNSSSSKKSNDFGKKPPASMK